jgi:Tol biopolymer transport system component
MNSYSKTLFILLLSFFSIVKAQDRGNNHPELDWETLKTEHFKVHFHNGAERSARAVAKIIEDIYGPITSFYDYTPDGTIHFIIRDHDDHSNGAAYYYDNKVEIWAPQMTFILRGTHNWLRNVVTHEFAHMISLGASKKITRKIPAFYLQWMGYESEKRPDVLYGYPNQLASYPIPMTTMPMWLAEGMAQYMMPGLDYDRWDSHRDMLIRTAVLSDQYHSLDEMGVFGKNSLGNERTYNAGYAFTRYIALNYGEEAIKKLAQEMSHKTTFTINGALENVTGIKANELYSTWQNGLASFYKTNTAEIANNVTFGDIVVPKGIGNILPAWSPDGKSLAFCGSNSLDYLTRTSLRLYDIKSKKVKTIKGGINSPVSWSSDGKTLLYTKTKRGSYGSHYFDIYRYNLASKKETRLTKEKRTLEAHISPDGENIIAIVQKDGTDNLQLSDATGKLLKKLTHFEYGEAVYSPKWSPDGTKIVFSKARNHGRDIYLADVKTGELWPILQNQRDARDPSFDISGEKIYFSWDKTGIFNIYSMDLSGKNIQQWTNVIGGAFMPSISSEGKLAYSLFKYDGYKIAVINNPVEVQSEKAKYFIDQNNAPELKNLDNFSTDKNLTLAREYDDTKLPTMEAKPYGMTYGQVSFLPRVMVDSNKVKLGTYFYASDILDRYSVLGGVAMNARKDLDTFAMFQYSGFVPTLFVELYAFTRNIQRSIGVIEDYPTQAVVDIGFNILEADIGATVRMTDWLVMRGAFVHSRYTSKIKDFFFQNQKWVSPMNTYFIGNHFQFRWNIDTVVPKVDSRINPSAGRKIEFTYTREFNDFFEDFATNNDYGTPQEVYSDYDVNRYELHWNEFTTLPWAKKHALSAEIRAGIVDKQIDSFFHFFAGGMPGLRGYPFYSIEGRKLLVGRFTYRMPILSHFQKRFLHLTTDKFYVGAFMDYGNAFNASDFDLSSFKKDVGMSLRFSAFSFYGFPTAISLETAYGLDEFDHENVKYGKEWRYYITLLFDYLN